MNPLDRIGVAPAERALFTWAALCLLLLGAAAAALQNSAETLFLKRVGVEYLPVAFLVSSLILVLGTGAAGRWLGTVDRPRWLPGLLALLGLTLVPVWALVYVEVPGILWALLMLVELLEAIGLLGLWLALGDLVTARQAKRLFAPLAAGATIGRLVGSFATEPTSRIVGIEGMVLIAGGLHALAALAGLGLALVGRRARVDAQPTESQAGGDGSGRSALRRGPRFRRIWAESRLFRLLLIWSFCAGTLGPMVYFQFSYAVNLATAGENGEQELIALYSQFRGWLYSAILVTQLGLSARLYRRFGIPLTTALWPLIFLSGFVWLGLSMQLRAALSTIGAIRLEGNAVAKPGVKILHNLLPDRLRSAAISWTEGPISHLGGAAGNAMVMGFAGLWGASMVSAPAIPIALVWLAASLVLWRLYPSLLLQAATDHDLSLSDAEMADLLDPATLRVLATHLSSPDPDVCRAAAELIGEADPVQATGVLTAALESAPPPVRPVLTDALLRLLERTPPGEIRHPAASEVLARVLEDPDSLPPDQRSDLTQIYARLTGGDPPVPGSDSILERTLDDPEAAVRLAAMAELHRRRRPPPGIPNLDAALERAFGSGDVLMRRTARKELRASLLSGDPDAGWGARLDGLASGLERRVDRAAVAEGLVEVARRHGGAAHRCANALLSRGRDADPRVRAAVLAFIGHAGLSSRRDDLVLGLASLDEIEAEGARDGLVALAADAIEPLSEALPHAEGQQIDRILDVLERIGTSPEGLADLQRRSLDSMRRDAVTLAALSGDTATSRDQHLVLRRLAERMIGRLRAVLGLLAIIESDERIARLSGQLEATDDQHRRAILAEALESMLTRGEDRRALLPLLESADPRARGEVAAAQLGAAVPSHEEAWSQLETDPDDLLRRLRAELPPPWLEGREEPSAEPRILGGMEPPTTMADTRAVQPLEPMQIAAFLQRVPGFERLSTRQLMRVADAAAQVRVRAGEPLTKEGAEETSLYVLVEGRVSITAGGRQLDELGPGSLLGELSSLDGGSRSESIESVEDVVALRLERSDLMALMAESPGLGAGLAQLMARRVRSLQDQLGEEPSA